MREYLKILVDTNEVVGRCTATTLKQAERKMNVDEGRKHLVYVVAASRHRLTTILKHY